MLKASKLSVMVGLVLFCTGAVFASGQAQLQLMDISAEPEAPESGGVAALNQCFFGDQSLCDNLSQNADDTQAGNALRCTSNNTGADVSTGYWRLFDLDQDFSADAGLGFHADINGTVVSGGEYCIGQVNWFQLAKDIDDKDNEVDGPGGDDFVPGDTWDDTEGPVTLTLRAFCVDEGIPFVQQFLDAPTELNGLLMDCGGNPGTLEFGPRGKKWDNGGIPANPDGFECFFDGVSQQVKHCCDADTKDLAIEILTDSCCNGGDNGYGGQVCGQDTDGDTLVDITDPGEASIACEFNIAAQNTSGETISGYLGGGECLAEPVPFGPLNFPSLHLVITVDEFIEPIPATTRVGAVVLVMALLGSAAYFYMRRRVTN